MNLFTEDNIKAGAKSGETTYIGEIVDRNGVPSYRIAPAPFYRGSGVDSNTIAKGMFASNTCYIFDIWMDVDDVVYNENNVAAGLTLKYTDNTSESIALTGNKTSPIGFQHKILFSDSSKTVSGIGVYYYTSIPVYYRLDSYVAPLSNPKFYKNGIIEANNTSEMFSSFGMEKGGLIKMSEIMEY